MIKDELEKKVYLKGRTLHSNSKNRHVEQDKSGIRHFVLSHLFSFPPPYFQTPHLQF